MNTALRLTAHTRLLLLLLLRGGATSSGSRGSGSGSRGGSGDLGELLRAGLDDLSDVLALQLGDELRDAGSVRLDADCAAAEGSSSSGEFIHSGKLRQTASGRRATRTVGQA